jgi:hypothetical protein
MVGHITAELFLGARMSRYFSTSWAATVNSGMKTAKPSTLCKMRPPAQQKSLPNSDKTGISIGVSRLRHR